MYYTITHLKAPWPKGAVIGDVIELGPTLPAWAVGKAVPAGEGAQATVDAEDIVVGDGRTQALPDMQSIRAHVDGLNEQLRAAHDQIEGQRDSIQKLIVELKEGIAKAKVLEDKLAAAEAANATLTSDKDAALAAAAEARDKLAAAEAAAVDAAANAGNTTKKK